MIRIDLDTRTHERLKTAYLLEEPNEDISFWTWLDMNLERMCDEIEEYHNAIDQSYDVIEATVVGGEKPEYIKVYK